jgi:flagellar basal body-associated protein FliL
MSRREYRTTAYARPPSNGNWLVTTFLVGTIGLLAAGAGFVAPQILNPELVAKFGFELPSAKPATTKKLATRASGQQPVSIPFGEAVVNLAEERLTRHLQVRITLLASGSDQELLESSLEDNRAILMNWLIGYLSDKSLEEVRGAAGVNRARRDIQDRFNSLLFADGSEKVRDVLFEEFTVR